MLMKFTTTLRLTWADHIAFSSCAKSETKHKKDMPAIEGIQTDKQTNKQAGEAGMRGKQGCGTYLGSIPRWFPFQEILRHPGIFFFKESASQWEPSVRDLDQNPSFVRAYTQAFSLGSAVETRAPILRHGNRRHGSILTPDGKTPPFIEWVPLQQRSPH